MVEIIDLKRHAEILRGYHVTHPLRITMADPVPGIAQPRLADNFRVLHLATTTLAIIVGMLPPAIGPDRATIVRIVAELAHVLDHHGDAVGIAFAEMATRRVVRPFSTEHDGAVGDVVAALALPAEAVILELQHGGEGEGVIGAGEIDILRAHAGIRPEDVLGVVTGNGGNRPGLVVHVRPRF